MMQRSVQRLSDETFDLLVIGAGISGAAIAWDAALRGLRVALIDKRDFGAATSAATGKLIHGGLRYLKNGQVNVVRESLRERRIMETIAPHHVHPLPFVIPTYSFKDVAMLKVGMLAYDMLGWDKKALADPEKRIPNHRRISRAEVLRLFPELPREKLNGGVLYYDCQMDAPERLTLSFVQSAQAVGAAVANWTEVTGFEVVNRRIRAVHVCESVSRETFDIRADVVVNATGCWADHLLNLLAPSRVEQSLSRSKGIHILFPAIHSTHALAMITRSKRHVYMLPWRNLTLAGTTDTPYRDHPDDFRVTRADIEAFIDELNDCYHPLRLSLDDILATYGGIRPLADTDSAKDSYQASRRHEVVDHSRDGLADNLLSAMGGKYTTSRQLAEHVVDRVYAKLQRKSPRCATAVTPLVHAPSTFPSRMVKQAQEQHPHLPAELIGLLVSSYGTAWELPLGLCDDDATLAEPLWKGALEIGAQILYAAKSEMAVHLQDAVFRRTGLCTVGHPGKQVLKDCAAIMGQALGWDQKRGALEVSAVEDLLSMAE